MAGGEAAAKTYRFTSSHDVELTLQLRGAPRSGTLLRFIRNDIALHASRSGALRLRRRSARSPRAGRTARGARRVKVHLSGRAGRVVLAVRGRRSVLAGRLVREDAVQVRADRAVRTVRIRPGRPVGDQAKAPSPTPTAMPTRLFAPGSVWNTPLAAGTPLDPRNAVLTKTLRDTVAQNLAAGWGPWIERGATSPLYTVHERQPKVRVQLDPGSWKVGLQQTFEAVPIPANATLQLSDRMRT